jgi:hypothetical protein
MLLKTKENENDNLTYPTISMKTNGLFFLTHDMYENKGTCSPPGERWVCGQDHADFALPGGANAETPNTAGHLCQDL